MFGLSLQVVGHGWGVGNHIDLLIGQMLDFLLVVFADKHSEGLWWEVHRLIHFASNLHRRDCCQFVGGLCLAVERVLNFVDIAATECEVVLVVLLALRFIAVQIIVWTDKVVACQLFTLVGRIALEHLRHLESLLVLVDIVAVGCALCQHLPEWGRVV